MRAPVHHLEGGVRRRRANRALVRRPPRLSPCVRVPAAPAPEIEHANRRDDTDPVGGRHQSCSGAPAGALGSHGVGTPAPGERPRTISLLQAGLRFAAALVSRRAPRAAA